MNRNLKILGLALMAVLALSAVAASAASAQQGKLTSDGPVTLIGTETGLAGSGANALTAFGNKVECSGSSYTGHKLGSTTELVPSGSTTATLTPHYKQANHNCKIVTAIGSTLITTTDMNGCDYVVHLGLTTGGVAHTYGATFDVVCPVGKEITITVWTTANDHTENKPPMCVQHIPAQVGKTGGHATDTTNGQIDLTGPFTGIQITQTASQSHPFLCPHSTTSTAQFDFDVLVSGRNSLGGATPISLTE